MTKPLEQWTVLPHGNLTQIDENILTVVGEIYMPRMDLPRRMAALRWSQTLAPGRPQSSASARALASRVGKSTSVKPNCAKSRTRIG
jgi:hypothetical protein